jgi:hypothetical protein
MGWLLLLPVSCASDSGAGKPAASATPAYQPMSQRLEQKNGYTQDTKGNWVPQNDKRSSFESQGKSPYFDATYGKTAYRIEPYAKKSWWGNKHYGRKPYAGNTAGSRFQKTSDSEGRAAPETGSAAAIPGSYQKDSFATGSARESRVHGVTQPTDAETEARRKVYAAPEIIDWREQRSLSLEQSKGILGR